jgi:ligand-binding SRPBCC domain-containing protein
MTACEPAAKGARAVTLIVYRSKFDVPARQLFAFHTDVTNLPRISPPLPRFRLLTQPKPVQAGDVQVIRMSVGPVVATLRARAVRVVDGKLIEDVQQRGPFRAWRHQHRIREIAPGRCELTDAVAFRFFPTRLGHALDRLLVPGLMATFAWRHWRTRRLLYGRHIARGPAMSAGLHGA